MYFRSLGIAVAPAITLNKRYHWVPISISNTADRLRPPGKPSITNKTIGKSAVAGTEAVICTTGCSQAARRGLLPMTTPRGTVQTRAIIRAASTRSSVAITPMPMVLHWLRGHGQQHLPGLEGPVKQPHATYCPHNV